MLPIQFDQSICTNLNRASELEWLETNGLGGFASSTITGLNRRRYHGLLVAATKPPVGRVLLLSKLEETLRVDGRRFDLSTNQYPGAIHPTGFNFLREFRLDPFPVFIYQVDGLEIEKRVFMVHGENTTVIEYELRSVDRDPLPACSLELRPLIAFRDYHSTTHRNDALNTTIESVGRIVCVTPYPDLPSLFFSHDADQVEHTGDWYYNFEYQMERDRGLDFQEDLFNPFVLEFSLNRRVIATVIVSTEPHEPSSASTLRNQEIARRKAVLESSPLAEPLVQRLTAAADHYVVRRGDFQTIIAGYHWFTDWGRDTMIALPGLTLVTGRVEAAKQILRAFGQSIDRGMLPNRFPDAGEAPEFNTVDATLWFFEAIRSFVDYTGDYAFVREHLYQKLKEIVEWHLAGTRYGIRVSEDGLLNCGEKDSQLTWMDARVDGTAVTPRTGKPVEIQALWYNALCILQDLARTYGDTHVELFARNLAEHLRSSFNVEFWNEAASCLYDAVDGDFHDASIRPNQIFVVSLHHGMLPLDRARAVVNTVRSELLTPLGLRTLSPRDPRYRPRYEGGVPERDGSYHQGTVWPWLMGPFITAYMKINGGSSAARDQAHAWLQGLDLHLSTAGLGHISEIADAENGHQPRGCIAQAWSVAELLRAAVEDVYRISRVAGTAISKETELSFALAE